MARQLLWNTSRGAYKLNRRLPCVVRHEAGIANLVVITCTT
jgi:hypothetical protein